MGKEVVHVRYQCTANTQPILKTHRDPNLLISFVFENIFFYFFFTKGRIFLGDFLMRRPRGNAYLSPVLFLWQRGKHPLHCSSLDSGGIS